jgi:hypothetical protein
MIKYITGVIDMKLGATLYIKITVDAVEFYRNAFEKKFTNE